MYIPYELGFIEQVHPDDVKTITVTAESSLIEFSEEGHYFTYGDNGYVPGREPTSPPWLLIQEQGTEQNIVVQHVLRGLRPYDTPVIEGRPVFSFEIEQPGTYEFARIGFPDPTTINIVPDYTTGHEGFLLASFLTQVILICFIPTVVVFRRSRHINQEIRIVQMAKREKADAVWDELIRDKEESE